MESTIHEILKQLIREELGLLRESNFGTSPKCIFLGGPSGAGKSTLIREYIPKGFKEINSDDEYEKLLRRANIGMKQKDFDSEKLSKAAKMQARARKSTEYRLQHSVDQRLDIIIDGTAASVNPVKKQKKELEDIGYDTFMILLFVSPLVSLQRNMMRGDAGGRELQPDIVLRTWRGVRKNIDDYRRLFGNDIVVLDNNPDDAITNFKKDMIEPFFSKVDRKFKPKSPEEIAKRQAQKDKMYKEIEDLSKEIPKTDTRSDLKSQLNRFLRK